MGKVGYKRQDKRFRAPDGVIWASEFEWIVYDTLRTAKYNVRKCDEGDTISYMESRRNSRCLQCGSNTIVQDRTYTPDLCVYQEEGRTDGPHYYIEVKGYFRPASRKLFREMVKRNPTYPLRVIFEKNQWVTRGKSTYADYFDRYLKTIPYVVWGDTYDYEDGSRFYIPEEWNQWQTQE